MAQKDYTDYRQSRRIGGKKHSWVVVSSIFIVYPYLAK